MTPKPEITSGTKSDFPRKVPDIYVSKFPQTSVKTLLTIIHARNAAGFPKKWLTNLKRVRFYGRFRILKPRNFLSAGLGVAVFSAITPSNTQTDLMLTELS